MAAPVVPPGVNPFTYYIATLDSYYEQYPSRGFKARMFVQAALAGVVILLSFVYLALLWVDARRKGANMWWLVRLRARPSGRYIALNSKLWTVILGIIALAVQLGYAIDCEQAYTGTPLRQLSSPGWRPFSPFVLIFHGWFVVFGLLQAYLLTPEQENGFVTATRANLLFVGGVVIISASVLTTASITTWRGNNLSSSIGALRNHLVALVPTWTGTTNVADLIPLQILLNDVNAAIVKYKDIATAHYALMGAFAVFIAVLNLGSFALTRLLRRQIAAKARQFTATSQTATQLAMGAGSQMFSVDDSGVLSRSAMRRLAKADDGQAAAIVQLQKAERDLLVISATVFVIATVASAVSLFVSIEISLSNIYNVGWAAYEFGFSAAQWCYIVIYGIGMTALVFNAAIHLAPKPRGGVESIYVNGGDTGAGLNRHTNSSSAPTQPSTPVMQHVKVNVEHSVIVEGPDDCEKEEKRAVPI